MSQVYLGASANPAVPIQFTADTGIAVPAGNNLNILGENGIVTSASGSTVTISQDIATLSGTVQTIGAVTGDTITFDLGAVPGTYKFTILTAAFEPTGPESAGYFTKTTFRTNGAAAFLTGTVDTDSEEDIPLLGASMTAVASGNNIIIRVTGVAGLTVSWKSVAEYVFISELP